MSGFADIHTHKINAGRYAVQSLDVEQWSVLSNDTGDNCFSLGVHPWNVHKTDISLLDKLKNILASDLRVKAVGECGLDKNSMASAEQQILFFKEQVVISEVSGKPLIIHCVGAFNEIIKLKKNLRPEQKWIIHGFRGKPQLAEELLTHGFYLSFGEKFNEESVRLTPQNRLCVETDESELPIAEIYRKICDVKSCRPEDIVIPAEVLNL
ncbi:MAG: TatD family hydrolase [Paludibacter sp.]|nr:TatD family hydrolase [Paludibacter sp.]